MDGEGGSDPRTPRSLVVATFLATLLVSAAAGSFVFRRYRRAAGWLAVDLGMLGLFGLLAPGSAQAMWGGMVGLHLLRLVAAIDAVRIARAGAPSAPIGRVVTAWVCATLLLFGTTRLVKATRVEAFQMPSASMVPTLLVGDHVMVDKRRRPIGPGDVIVFRYPVDRKTTYAKRVVAVGGDVVEIEGRQLIVNGVPAQRRDLERPCGPELGLDDIDLIGCEVWEETLAGRTIRTIKTPNGGQSFPKTVVPPGHLFVLGDNRDNSSDSRTWGPLPEELVVGRVAYIYYSSGPQGARWDRVKQVVK